MMNGLVAYVRVSTEEQRLSPAAQEQAIRHYCRLYELGEPEIVADLGCSGKDVEGRPGLRQILAAIEAGQVQAVVCYKLDRLFRSAKVAFAVFEAMQARGVALHSVQEKLDTSTAMGRFAQGMILLLAQLEREQTAERTSFALQGKKAAAGGRPINGRAPYGFQWSDGRLIEHPTEQKVMNLALALSGHHNPEGVATHLNACGASTRSGRTWTPRQVRRLLVRDSIAARVRSTRAE